MNGAGALRKARGAPLAQERNLWQCELSALYFVRLDFSVFPLTSLKDSIGHSRWVVSASPGLLVCSGWVCQSKDRVLCS